MRAFLVVLVCLIPATALAAQLPDSLVTPYLHIHATLLTDKTKDVQTDAAAVATAAAALGPEAKRVESAARDLEKAAPSLKNARNAFAKLTDALTQYAQATSSTLPKDMKLAYCPMVRQSWLQKGEKIANPYGGKDMSSCGEFKKF